MALEIKPRKIGTVRYTLDVSDGTVYWSEWVLRSVSRRKKYLGITWSSPVLVEYWVSKIDGLTWGKRSKKHGDFGWLKNIPASCRWSSFAGDDDTIGRPTKLAAIKEELKTIKHALRSYGDDIDEEDKDMGFVPYSVRIKKLEQMLAREQGKRKRRG